MQGGLTGGITGIFGGCHRAQHLAGSKLVGRSERQDVVGTRFEIRQGILRDIRVNDQDLSGYLLPVCEEIVGDGGGAISRRVPVEGYLGGVGCGTEGNRCIRDFPKQLAFFQDYEGEIESER